MMLNFKIEDILIFIGACLMIGCAAGVEDPGVEFAPQMYHSVPYEPLSQITDRDIGKWLDSNDEDQHGEFYNSNPYNKYQMTMRLPVANTIRRGQYLPYRFKKDDLSAAAETLKNPITLDDEQVLKEGKRLYKSFCEHCHGEKGNADGLVAEAFAGIANLNGVAYKNLTEGHIFHVITHGKGLMGAHSSQISQEDRWKITRYVKKLQKN